MNGFLLPVAPKAGPCLVDNRPPVSHCPPADCWYGGVAEQGLWPGWICGIVPNVATSQPQDYLLWQSRQKAGPQCHNANYVEAN